MKLLTSKISLNDPINRSLKHRPLLLKILLALLKLCRTFCSLKSSWEHVTENNKALLCAAFTQSGK